MNFFSGLGIVISSFQPGTSSTSSNSGNIRWEILDQSNGGKTEKKNHLQLKDSSVSSSTSAWSSPFINFWSSTLHTPKPLSSDHNNFTFKKLVIYSLNPSALQQILSTTYIVLFMGADWSNTEVLLKKKSESVCKTLSSSGHVANVQNILKFLINIKTSRALRPRFCCLRFKKRNHALTVNKIISRPKVMQMLETFSGSRY